MFASCRLSFIRHLLISTMLCCILAIAGELKLASPFSDHMVLQRDAEVAVWGSGRAGSMVAVRFRDQVVTATVNATGNWRVNLQPMSASDRPGNLQVTMDGESLTLHDILTGDVWLGSGQSNMDWPLRNCANATEEIAAANYPAIRIFQVAKKLYGSEQDTCGGKWEHCTPKTAKHLSGLAYYFALELQRDKTIPVGIIQTSWGGSPIEAWMNKESLLQLFPEKFDQLHQADWLEALQADYRQEMAEWKASVGTTGQHTDPGIMPEVTPWSEEDFDHSSWQQVVQPQPLERFLGAVDGAVWYRKTVVLDDDWQAGKAVLSLGPIDDFDHVWINGHLVGITGKDVENFWKVHREYLVSPGVLKAGKNTIAVRIFDHGGGGGMMGIENDLFLSIVDQPDKRISLAGPWYCKPGIQLPAKPSGMYTKGTILYNGMIHPLAPFTMKGMLWYQGESNKNKQTQKPVFFHWKTFPHRFFFIGRFAGSSSITSFLSDFTSFGLKNRQAPRGSPVKFNPPKWVRCNLITGCLICSQTFLICLFLPSTSVIIRKQFFRKSQNSTRNKLFRKKRR